MNRNTNQFATSISLRVSDGVQDHSDAGPRAYPAGNADQALFRLDLRRSLEMHRRLALGFAICGLLLGTAYLVRFWHVYTAQALVYIQPTPSAVLEGAAPMHWPYNYDPATYDSYVAQQMLSMKRPDVLIGALHRLNPGTFQQHGESDENAADRLSGAIEVKRVETSYQVSITAHASNPGTAAALANAVAAAYIEDTKHEQKAGDAERLAMLMDERDRVKKELDDDRSEQATLNAQLGVAAIGPVAPEHYDNDIATIHDELVKARADHDEVAARLTSVIGKGGLSSAALDAEADTLIATDPGLATLKSALLQRRAVLVSQMANLTPSHPLYKQDEAELVKIDASLEASTQELRAKAAAHIEEQLRTDLDRTSGLEARLNVQLAEMTKAAAGATPKLQRSSDLASDIERLQNRFNTVDEQLQNQTLEDNAPGTAHLAVAAIAPVHPSVAGVIRNAMVLFIFFVMLGLASAVIAQKMDPRVYIASDIEQLLGFAPMALLPDFDEVPDEVADEYMLRLAAGIEYACKNGGVRTCVLTGTGPGAGVTTIATRLRQTLGLLGRKALLVNASGSAPAASHREAEESRSIHTTALRSTALVQPRIAALETSSGTVSQEGVASESLVLTDAAPLNVSAEAEYLARCADCTFLVVESGVTTRDQLRAAAGSLQRLDPATVGLVLNRVGLAKADPAFRRSVEDVATHLRYQNRASTRHSVRNLDPQAVIAEPEAPAKQEIPVSETALNDAPAVSERSAEPEPVAVAPAEPVAPAPPQPPAPAPALWREVHPEPATAYATEPIPQPQPAPVVHQAPPEAEPVSKAAPIPEPALQPRFTPVYEELSPAFEPHPKWAIDSALPESMPIAPNWLDDQLAPKSDAAQEMNPEPEAELRSETEPSPEAKLTPDANPAPEAEPPTSPAPIIPAVFNGDQPEWLSSTNGAAQMAIPPTPEKAFLEPEKTFTAECTPNPVPRLGREDEPSWLTEQPSHSDDPVTKLLTRRIGKWDPDSNGSSAPEPTLTEAQPLQKAGPAGAPPHVSRLRGILFSLGVKEFAPFRDFQADGASGATQADAVAEPAPPPPDPGQPISAPPIPVPPASEAMFAPPPAPEPPLAPVPEPRPTTIPDPPPSHVAAPPTTTFVPRWVTAEPEFLPPTLSTPENGNQPQSENGKRIRRELGEALSGIQILPSKRGQYKRRS